MNLSPAMTSGICSWPINRRQVFSASRANLNTIVNVATRDPHPLVFFVRSLTVAQVDSIRLVVLICTQCAAGKS